jgi:multidrug transporter EmrE-like cation transporter
VSAPVADPSRPKEKLVALVGLILVSVTLASLAQLTLKAGMNQVTDATGTVTVSATSIKAIVTNVLVWGGLGLFGVSATVWIFVLSRTSLSFAYPFVALTYLIILLVDRFVLHESVPPVRWAGVGLIMAGIVLVSRTG